DYLEKWLSARRVTGKDAANIRTVLRTRAQQPHFRDLARNPMQLAILLSLMQRRGTSLPDQRTELYNSYVELFMDREGEKSSLVRDHREVLLDVHRYLAWVLHEEA